MNAIIILRLCPDASVTDILTGYQQIFFLAWRPDVTTTPEFNVVSIDGGVTSGDGTLEAVRDFASEMNVLL